MLSYRRGSAMTVSRLFLKASGTLNFYFTLPNIAIYLLFIIVQKRKDCFALDTLLLFHTGSLSLGDFNRKKYLTED